ncbi:unnamed protein product [Linum tenue]|uniref:1-deoxy-D-xylulose-5-phosphate synthase n=2 Tax=Linum tenue TaxID=586396 RepID=A0AAV0M7Q6_9ROSI|nr:unnamed protein product [Linum tenue]
MEPLVRDGEVGPSTKTSKNSVPRVPNSPPLSSCSTTRPQPHRCLGVVKFDVETGQFFKLKSSTLPYTRYFAESLVKEAEADNKILVHDVDLQKLLVWFAMERAGLVEVDGPTHCGAFNIAYMACLPNMVVVASSDEAELMQRLQPLAIGELVREHEILSTVEEGSIDGSGYHASYFLSLRVDSKVITDKYIEHGSPPDRIQEAGLSSKQITTMVRSLLGKA